MNYRVGLLLCGMLSFAVARENPFAVAMDPSLVGRTTHIKEERVEFNSTKITLPSSARILKSASVTFQNIDGSISEEIVGIEQDVDWHHPLILSTQKPQRLQEPTPINESSAVLPKTPVQTSKKGEIKKEDNPSMTPQADVAVKSFSRVVLSDGIELEINNNSIMIYTKEKKVRDFIVSNPYKIVVDFSKEKSSFVTKFAEFSKAPFISAALGNHDGFYRIAITLDGHYRYDIKPIDGGYFISLK